MLVDAGRAVGLRVELLHHPVERCRLILRNGELEASVAAPVPVNLELLDFPLRDGRPDRAQAIASLPLVWIRRADSEIDWDGEHLQPPGRRARVGTRHGVKVGFERLQALGVEIDSVSLDAEQLLRRLQAGRFDLALLMRPEFDAALERDPSLRGLVALERPLDQADFYIALAKTVGAERRAQAQAWLQEIARLRKLAAYSP